MGLTRPRRPPGRAGNLRFRGAFRSPSRARREIVHVVGPTTGDDPIGSVGAELTSDLSEEDLSLIETNASRHGSAPIAALPKTDADLTVVLYDAGSAALISFSGALGADGSVKLVADATRSPPDIELHSVELFSAVKGTDFGLGFVGVDTYDVAYGVVFLTEGGDKICLATDEKGTCVKWALSEEVTTRSEVYWNDIGAVWEAEALTTRGRPRDDGARRGLFGATPQRRMRS